MKDPAIAEQKVLSISGHGTELLKETAKWARLLAILGYVGVGFTALVGVLIGFVGVVNGIDLPGSISSVTMTGVYLGMALLYFFPVHYLFRFSSGMRSALSLVDQQALEQGLVYLKRHYKFMGIMAIVICSLYVLIFVFGILAGLTAAIFA